MRNAFGMPDRIGDRNRATLRQAVKREAIEARRIDHGFEIAHEILEADIRHVTVRKSVTAGVIADERVVA